MPSTLTSPATARVTLNSGRNPRSPAARRKVRLERRHDLPVDLDRGLVVARVAVRLPPEGGQRRAVRRDDPDLAAERGGEAHDDRLRAGEPGRTPEAVGERDRRVVEPLLLLVRQHGLVAVADDAVDDDPDEQQDRDDGDAEQQPEAPRQRSAGAADVGTAAGPLTRRPGPRRAGTRSAGSSRSATAGPRRRRACAGGSRRGRR